MLIYGWKENQRPKTVCVKFKNRRKKVMDVIKKGTFYYYIDAPTGIQFGRSHQRIKVIADVNQAVENKDFIDYPRVIICNLNDLEDKINWKTCEVNKEFLVSLKDKLIKYFP